ncbi:HlyD family efflux transporter periplasmic adaptor subunit [Clostridium sp. Sa3CUN1]|uniref:HlyD family efflux transporter periplasmic adaptor subunit n=1 Tax=Clostridium gallinarum TaxID=2762246 RepID=A0ABR8PZE0_9CLOT|nr:HlyD family efflux transporter periplasmic adaptor subunit [Clostridium gallinarum]MBD7913541.1 HlyD family efflux transporter periplasmic adaptor subunit [Clostridium gallinarum]
MKKRGLKNLMLKNKKKVVIVSTLFVLGSALILRNFNRDTSSQDYNFEMSERIVKLQKGEINNSVIVSGKIKSGEVSNVSSTIAAKVKSINVKVGDTVKAGDIICVLDDSNIVKEIESKSKSIEEEKKSLQDNYNKLSNQLEILKSAKDENSKKQNKLIEEAENKLNNANAELNSYEVTFNSIKNTYNIMINGLKDKQASRDNAELAKKKYYEEWIKSGGKVNSEEYKKYIEASSVLEQKEEELNEAKALYDYDNISNNYNESLATYNEKVSLRDEAKNQYDEAISNSIASANASDVEIDNIKTNMNDLNSQIQKLNDNEELKELKENLSKTVLKAETSGKITELKVNVGSMAEGIIGTIQSTENLILEVNIPEYDIKKLNTGMKVKISSDALLDKVDGELISISPIASSDDKGGFSADISINNGSGLFIGTNAKAEIIISSKENVILAPIDSIKDIDTNPKVLLKEDNGEMIEVPVIIGEKNDYYVEISGDNIKEGMEIEADINSYDSELDNSYSNGGN